MIGYLMTMMAVQAKDNRDIFAYFTVFVGLSMMCYTFGKEKRTCLGDFQLSGLIGKLLY